MPPFAPTGRLDTAIVAWPPLSVPGAPRLLGPILSWTVPVGVPTPGATALTVTVKFTVCPKTEGFGDEVSDVAVLAWLTACESAEDVLLPGATAATVAVNVTPCPNTDGFAEDVTVVVVLA